jgi:hypothetical protein
MPTLKVGAAVEMVCAIVEDGIRVGDVGDVGEIVHVTPQWNGINTYTVNVDGVICECLPEEIKPLITRSLELVGSL